MNSAATTTLESFVARSRAENAAAIAIITAITVPDGPMSFEKFSGCGTVRSILRAVDEDTAHDLVAVLAVRLTEMAGLDNPETSRSNQQAAIDHLSGMIRDRQVILSRSNDGFGPAWVSTILVTLAKYGCEVTSNRLPTEVRTRSRNALLASLGHLLSLNQQNARLLPTWLACKIWQDHQRELEVYRDADEAVVKTLEKAITFPEEEGEKVLVE